MRRILALFAVPLIGAGLLAFQPQGPQGPPRRIENPQDMKLPGGSQVLFRKFAAPSLENRQMGYSVFLPPSYGREKQRSYPVIFFLHGLFNDHTSWAAPRYGDVPQALDSLLQQGRIAEFIMVHPNGENSFYIDSADGSRKYEKYVTEDLAQEIAGHFQIRQDRAGRALAGTSMGGYGALKIAMKHPSRFGSAAAASPIVFLEADLEKLSAGTPGRRGEFFAGLFGSIFGRPVDPEHWRNNNIEYLAKNSDLHNLRFYIAYGTADRYNNMFPMEAGIRGLDEILTRRGINHTLRIFEGEPHGWELVERHLPEMLEFLTQGF